MCETKQHVILVILKVTTQSILFTDGATTFLKYHFHEIAKAKFLIFESLIEIKTSI